MRALLLVACLAFPAAAMAGGPLNIGQGTGQLGGSATLDLGMGNGESDISVVLAPNAGYFVANRVELVGGFSLVAANGGEFWGLEFGARYVTPMGNSHAYAGGTVGYGQAQANGLYGSDQVSLSGVGGFLLPLGPKVAVDLGGRITYLTEAEYLLIPLGYFGIQASF